MKRNYQIDNAKFLMIVLIVFGHLIEPLINSNSLLKALYMSIYSIHIPVFVILAGMLTKVTLTQSDRIRRIQNILVPLLCFTVLYEGVAFMVSGNFSEYGKNLQPYWILWFLWSLMVWRVCLPLFMRMCFPLVISIVLSLAVGYIDMVGYTLSLSRIVYFLPFFLMGHILGFSLFRNIILVKIPRAIYLFILVLNFAYFLKFNDLSYEWLYGSMSYTQLGEEGSYSSLIRLWFYVISFISTISVLMLIPKQKLKLTQLGSNSLYAYVWHGFAIKAIILLGVYGYLEPYGVVSLVIFFFIIALFGAALLSTRLIEKLTNKIIFKPVLAIIIRKNK